MSAETLLYILIAGVVSISLVIFMYGYKTKYTGRLRWLFGSLRFITLFSLFLLLINPKFKTNTYTIEKPNLPVLVDNSASMVELGQSESIKDVVSMLQNNTELNEKFELSFYSFGSDFAEMDSLFFSEKRTHISKALKRVDALFKNETAPTILITDGNQTLGQDYEFSSTTFSNSIYPIIAGDSTQYIDLKLEQLNTNRYSFLKNQFPVEALLVYSGQGSVNSKFIIIQGGRRVFSQNVSFSENQNTQTITTTLPASSVGLQRYNAQIVPLEDEKNKVNNSKAFAVEVIDQATNVLVVSSVIHPDLGALKKAIETNEQRTITFKKPLEAASILNDYQLIILYQPDRNFRSVYTEVTKLKKNTLTITGMLSDWNFINEIQQNFSKDATNQSEDVTAILNLNYGAYAVDDIGFEDFPPLYTEFGTLEINVPHETLLEQSIAGFSTNSPLIASTEINGVRNAIWDGEGFWRWRAHSYLSNESFEDFDEFVGNIVQYLASNKRRSRMEVTYETFYYNNNALQISAQYFDKNFVFDNRAQLTISVKNEETEELTVFPMLLKNNYYEVDLSTLPASNYSFSVSVKDEGIARSGNFTILEFNVEQQFLNANVTKLQRVATNTGGTAYFIDKTEVLIDALLKNEKYKPIQKSDQKVVPLIDWKYLLGLIVIALSAEWFIRKYNGLI
ncbi:MAG: VWA domain-containing protein [Flavobacteriaceae bacterium]|nr:VWA domain-containing protein [Flavobacteriaceae bacterium]